MESSIQPLNRGVRCTCVGHYGSRLELEYNSESVAGKEIEVVAMPPPTRARQSKLTAQVSSCDEDPLPEEGLPSLLTEATNAKTAK